MRRKLGICLIATLALLGPRAAFCQEGEATGATDEVDSATVGQIVEQILTLRRQIDALLDRLDDATRSAVERRLDELARTAQGTESSPETPPPETGSPPEKESTSATPTSEDRARSRADSTDSIREVPAEEATADRVASGPTAPTTPEEVASADAPIGDQDRAGDSSGCLPLGFLDSTEDATITGIDRAWRHLYLWTEASDDGSSDATVPDGVASLFELGVRALSADLDTYTNDREFIGDVELGRRWIWLEVPSRGRGRDFLRGALVLDADGLLRAGGPHLIGDDGEPLGGLRLLGRGARIAWPDGRRQVFPDCAP